MKTQPVWTSSDGTKIPYKEIPDKHFRAILRDGYRNDYLILEAKRRRIRVPQRPVDKLSYADVCIWLEAFASCAIEGNIYAEKMANLYRTNPALFMFHLNRQLVRLERDKASPAVP